MPIVLQASKIVKFRIVGCSPVVFLTNSEFFTLYDFAERLRVGEKSAEM